MSSQYALPADLWSSPQRPTRICVELDRISGNASAICQRLTAGTQLMAIVKANGYGHGACWSASAAIAAGATYLGVATLGEAIELRSRNIDLPIVVLGPVDVNEIRLALQHTVEVAAGSIEQINAVSTMLSKVKPNVPLRVHLKVDTGMNRYGLDPHDSVDAARRLSRDPAFDLVGVFTHFAESEESSLHRTDQQAAKFRKLADLLREQDIAPRLFHAANSGALLRSRDYDFDMVRAGLCLYGVAPSNHAPLFPEMKPALSWYCRIQRTATLQPGDRVGYGGTYEARATERIGLLPIGYADGYPRLLSNRGWVGCNGSRLPLRGRVSMDQTVVGLQHCQNISFGDSVTVLGDGSDGAPTAVELAELAETIPYEILSRIAPRVPVAYLRSGAIVAGDDDRPDFK
jgi:alanine racemase